MADNEILKPSPNFALEYDFAGHPYLWSLIYPYEQIAELDELYRILLSCFAGKGTRVGDAFKTFNKITRTKVGERSKKRNHALLESLKGIGALVPKNEVPSMYDASMTKYYAEFRKIPTQVVDWVIKSGNIRKNTKVLDLACGTGALSNQIAKVSRNVTGIDVSKSFLDQARREAKNSNHRVRYLHESCNRLALHNESYDVVVISCADHWLDPFQWAKGVLRVLNKKGRVLILTSGLFLPKTHPLNFLEPQRPEIPIKYYNNLYRAAWRVDKLRFVEELKFADKREFGVEFMRAWASQEHLKLLNIRGWKNPREFWDKLELKMKSLPCRSFNGAQEWTGLKLDIELGRR